MKKIIISLFLILISTSISYASQTNVENVYKIYSYAYNPLTQMYEVQASGSAVYIWDGKVITNAHVLIDSKSNPYNHYEVCQTYSFKERPGCFSVANLKHIDVESDLAYLSINSWNYNLWPGVSWSLNSVDIGDSVTVLGYPGTGWETITLSEWKISGYTNGYYKTDSDIDSWNSGGWVFNESGNFVWMPTLIVSDAANLGYIIGVEDILGFIDRAITEPNYSIDISSFKEHWNTFKRNTKNAKLISTPGIQIRNPGEYNYKIVTHDISDLWLSEYFLKSTRGDTYVEIGNFHVLESTLDFANIWDSYESNTNRKIIKRELKLGWKDLLLLAYIDLKTQDLNMFFYSQSSSYSIYGNMTESKPIIDALKMLISNTDILEQAPSKPKLSYSWYQIFTQDKLFSSIEVGNSTLVNYTQLWGHDIELSFETAWNNFSFDAVNDSYEDILEKYFIEWEWEEGYILDKTRLVRNKKWEIFILSKYATPIADEFIYTLSKYDEQKGVSWYYYANISLSNSEYWILKNDLITFFDTLEFDGNDPVTTTNTNSLITVSQFFQ